MGTFKFDYHTPIGYTPDSYLTKLCSDGIQTRYKEVTEEISNRLKYELNAISNYHLANGILMCWDFVNFAKNRENIMFGPGSGSEPGSLVLYVLGITNIDPVKYGLLFERFLYTVETIWLCAETQSDNYAKIINSYEKLQCKTYIERYSHNEILLGKSFKNKNITLGFCKIKELTIIKETLSRINKINKINFNIEDILFYDKKTYKMLASGNSDEIYLMGDKESQEILRDWRPKNIKEIAILIAIARPGPISKGIAQEFGARKNGKTPITYSHPILEKILKDTFGMIIYQEQIMQIANEMAGFSMIEANDLREVLGHLKFEQIKKYRNIFIQGAIDHGIESNIANNTFDQIEEYSQYTFVKSHAIACAIIAYQMAYLKANYPKEFQQACYSAT